MPYVSEDVKVRLIRDGDHARNVGELTYLLTFHALEEYTSAKADEAYEAMKNEIEMYLVGLKSELGYEANYAILCGVVGSLECARREFRRRRPDSYIVQDEVLTEVLQEFYDKTVAPYEDTKIEQNGDVF